jgi:cystathionine beta-synthase
LQLKDHFKPEDVVVVLFHDSGSRYVGKMFNDDWMRERGFLDEEITKAEDVIKDHIDKALIVVRTEELVSHAIERMRKYKISQIPVVDINGFVGSVDESDLFEIYVSDKNAADKVVPWIDIKTDRTTVRLCATDSNLIMMSVEKELA